MMANWGMLQRLVYGTTESRVRKTHIQRVDTRLKIHYNTRVHLVKPMPSFILTATDEDGTVTTKEFEGTLIQDVVEKTSDFLHGVGYVFEDLIVDEGEVETESTDWTLTDYVKEYQESVATETEV